MCSEVDYIPQIMVLAESNLLSSKNFHRKTSWTSSSGSVSSNVDQTSWFERKLFSHLKRLFRRQAPTSPIDSLPSSRRTSSLVETVPSSSDDESSKQIEHNILPPPIETINMTTGDSSISSSVSTENSPPSPIRSDSLYDYDELLARCLAQQEQHRTELLLRCQTPVSIPHADLVVGHGRSILINWKSYVRLFRALNRDPQIFQQYINQSYSCQSSINQRDQLTFTVRTSRTTFDNLLRTFLDNYVTCFECQKAQTNLIKCTNLWRVECQICGSQRTVERLRWKR